MVMFLLSFVKGVQIRGGESISASGYGPGGSKSPGLRPRGVRGSKSASGYGPGGSISASGFGPGGPILGGSKSAGTPGQILSTVRLKIFPLRQNLSSCDKLAALARKGW